MPLHGIPRGGALSHLSVAVSYVTLMDVTVLLRRMRCFMPNTWIIFFLLTRSRWQLRRGTDHMAEFFEISGFERHPNKTQIGRQEKGFD